MQIHNFILANKHNVFRIFLGIIVIVGLFFITKTWGVRAASSSQFTGCLSTNPGLLYGVKLGSSPISPCPTGDPEVSAISSIQHYQQVGTGINSITPASTWIDIPDASISGTFAPGVWKATYTGTVVMTNGDGTAYVRLEIRPNGGSPVALSNIVTMEHVSSPSQSEAISQPFTFQSLVTLPSGAVTIVPQVYSNNTSWSLLGPSTLILDQ